jgi:hypothetical protein
VAGELRVIEQVLEDLGTDDVRLELHPGGGEGPLDDVLELLTVLRRKLRRELQGRLRRDQTGAAEQRAEAQQSDSGEAATRPRAPSRAGYQPMACAPRRGSAPPRRTPSLPTTEAQTAPARQS